jgi:3alpha(or 20beta)-hydroxysteroid dehydrogenase
MSRLAGKVAIVTGGSRGLGASIVRLFHKEGAQVVVADVRDGEGKALVASLGERAHYRHLDVTSEQEWADVVAATRAHFGPPRLLVNNAGIYRVKPLEEVSVDEYMLVIRINQLGCFLGMRACVAAMREAGGGSIVNVASTAGLEGVEHALPYTASKHAVVGMTRAAALELAPSGIRVNAVCPGGMATLLVAESLNVPVEMLAKMHTPWNPMGRMGHPDEVAATALFLASDDSSYTTGSVLVADGGLMAGTFGGSPGTASGST